MVFLQKATRAFTTQRDVQISVRGKALDDMSNYLQTRLQKEKDPIYLHEVGDWITLSMNNNRGAAIRLRIMFKGIVKDIFDQ